MSLLLLSYLSKNRQSNSNSPGLVDSEGLALQQVKRTRLWLMTYIALFTSLLAFFILIISLIELEGSTPKRNYQKLMYGLHQQMLFHREQQGVPWLNIENTLTKGIRVTLPSDLVANATLFQSARAKINPRYLPYLISVVDVFEAMEMAELKQRYAKLIRGIEIPGYELKFMIRIEGHTDSNPLAATARFRNNVELSTYRAYAMMDWMRIQMGLPRDRFVIAGYGSFHPLVEDTTAPQNRRIEIYLLPKLIPVSKALAAVNEQGEPL